MGKNKTENILLVKTFVLDNDTNLFRKVKDWKLPFSKKAMSPPLELATIASLTPEEINVDLWDEAVQGEITEETRFAKEYDIVGITGYLYHMKKANAIAEIFRRRGITVVIGGPGVSSTPEFYRKNFDVLFIGEAEYIWPRFLKDHESGNFRKEYRQVSKVDIGDSPVPQWERFSIKSSNYFYALVQTTRGCPFDCEFCDVVYLFGRRVRQKPITQVLEEVANLQKLGFNHISFCDDNFYGNPGYTRKLLKELISMNNTFNHPMQFFCQLSLNVAEDDEVLSLLADANFTNISIGIESINKESLRESNKKQNVKSNIIEDVKKIQSYGLSVMALMMVGFDNDDINIFQQQLDFMLEAGIVKTSVNIRKAIIGTRLWSRLQKERRLIEIPSMSKQAIFEAGIAVGNIIPRGMSIVELLSGYREMLRKLSEWSFFEERVMRMLKGVKRKPDKRMQSYPLKEKIKSLINAVWFIFVLMDKDARQTTRRLLAYTRRNVPFMRGMVASWLAFQFLLITAARVMSNIVEKQINHIFENGIEPAEQYDNLFPDDFDKMYTDLFPKLLRYVYLGLNDKSYLETALVKIVVKFLLQNGNGMQEFGDNHMDELYKICDRIIAEDNALFGDAGNHETFDRDIIHADGFTGNEQKSLSKEILRFVVQELVTIQLFHELEEENLDALESRETALNI